MGNTRKRKSAARRRRKYDGQIKLSQRNNDIYYACWTEDGKTKTKSLRTRDQLEAEGALRTFRATYQKGGPGQQSNVTFHQAADDYLADRKLEVSQRCMDDYSSFIRCFKAHFNDSDLVRKVTTMDCERLRLKLLKKVVPYTVKKRLTVLRAIFKRLVRLRLLDVNPMDGIVQEGTAGVRSEMPEEAFQEYLTLLLPKILGAKNAIEKSRFRDLHDRALVLWWSGLRTIEVERVRWADIELEHPEGPRWTIKSPKKKGGTTTLPISPVLVPILQARLGNGRPGPFTGRIKTLNRAWKRITEEHPQFQEWDQHCIRHSFVSRISRTKGLAMARYLARHNTIEVSQRYDHRNLAEMRKALEDDVA